MSDLFPCVHLHSNLRPTLGSIPYSTIAPFFLHKPQMWAADAIFVFLSLSFFPRPAKLQSSPERLAMNQAEGYRAVQEER